MRPGLRALLEMEALLGAIVRFIAEGRAVYDASAERRWAMQRLWIAVGNAAVEYGRSPGVAADAALWRRLGRFRNERAHAPSPDIDDDLVWRTSALLPDRVLEHIAAHRARYA